MDQLLKELIRVDFWIPFTNTYVSRSSRTSTYGVIYHCTIFLGFRTSPKANRYHAMACNCVCNGFRIVGRTAAYASLPYLRCKRATTHVFVKNEVLNLEQFFCTQCQGVNQGSKSKKSLPVQAPKSGQSGGDERGYRPCP